MSSPESQPRGAEATPAEPPPTEQRISPRAPWTGGDVAITLTVWFALLVASVGVVAIITGGLTLTAFWLAALVANALAFAIGWYVCLKRRRATWQDAGFRPTKAAWLLGMIPAAVGVLVLNSLLGLLAQQLFGGAPDARDQLGLGDDPLSGLELLLILALVAVAAPVLEEFVFRGILYRYFRPKTGALAATLVSATLFAVLHLIPPLFISLFVLGVVLAFVVEKSGSLYPAIALHALNNGAIVVVIAGSSGAA